nr:hypothetical protein [Tanacetum cinerariifolium]
LRVRGPGRQGEKDDRGAGPVRRRQPGSDQGTISRPDHRGGAGAPAARTARRRSGDGQEGGRRQDRGGVAVIRLQAVRKEYQM